jgi:hypothetical protein
VTVSVSIDEIVRNFGGVWSHLAANFLLKHKKYFPFFPKAESLPVSTVFVSYFSSIATMNEWLVASTNKVITLLCVTWRIAQRFFLRKVTVTVRLQLTVTLLSAEALLVREWLVR